MLHLQTYQDPGAESHAGCSSPWVSGGVSSARALKQTYGKYLMRVRSDQGAGVSAIALLWPSNNSWPPEIDFFEAPGSRTSNQATLHCGSGGSDGCQVHKSITADFSQWHTVGVEWTPQMISYTLDGSVWATVPSNTASIPSINMELDIQAQAGTCGGSSTCPDATTASQAPGVDMQVDWVVAYAAAGA
jgi:beta-glucanase (GH16 family)